MIRNYDSSMPDEVNEYFRWLVRTVDVDISGEPELSYLLLMRALFKKEFYWVLDRDEYRAMDGLYLREQFFDSKIDLGPCRVLEMLVGLASRCETDLLGNSDNQTGEWFWDMIENLGLERFVDTEFDADAVDIILDRWLDRDYDQNGCGGLFYTEREDQDMRELEIWWQLQLYVMQKFDEKHNQKTG